MTVTVQPRKPAGTSTGGQYAETSRAEADVDLGLGVSTQCADHSIASPGMRYLVGPFESRYFLPDGEEVTADEIAARGSWNGVRIVAGESQFTVPSFTPASATESPVYGVGYDGSKSAGYRPVVEVAKDIRADIKDAVKVGWLPDLEYRVSTSHSTSIRVLVVGLSDQDRVDPDKDPQSYRRTDREQVSVLERRLGDIMRAYNRSRTDSMTDYFDESFYQSVRVESELDARYRAAETERVKAARAARSALTRRFAASGRSGPTLVQGRVLAEMARSGPLTTGAIQVSGGRGVPRGRVGVGSLTRSLVEGGHGRLIPSGRPPLTSLHRSVAEFMQAHPQATPSELYAHLGITQTQGDRELTYLTGLSGPLRLSTA